MSDWHPIQCAAGGLLALLVVLPAACYLCAYAVTAGRLRSEFNFFHKLTRWHGQGRGEHERDEK